MRKASPELARENFSNVIKHIDQFFIAGLTAFDSDSQHSTLAEQSFLSAAVAWEGFLNDLFLAYINRDSSVFSRSVIARAVDHLGRDRVAKSLYGKFVSKPELPKHLKLEEIEALADSRGVNITFANYAEIEKKAKAWLTKVHCDRFVNLSQHERKLIEAVFAIRNHLAHNSESSKKTMNEITFSRELEFFGLRRTDSKFHNVGAWLKATPIGLRSKRLTLFLGSLNVIAGKL